MDAQIKQTLKNLPKGPGVYLFKDGAGAVLYVGKAKNLYNRVWNYFTPARLAAENRPKVMVMVKWVRRIDIIETKTEAEALILESRLLKEYKPKYNSAWLDDKRFLLIRVDGSVLPRFTLCRTKADGASTYYGPFIHGPALRALLIELRRKYGILLAEGSPQKIKVGATQNEDVWRLYDDVRAEIYEAPNECTRAEYMTQVAKANAFLMGHTHVWREEVFEKMRSAAEAHHFEEAARWRDLLAALKSTREQKTNFLKDPMLNLLDPVAASAALQEALGLGKPPEVIECFDISHISGSFVVASCVRFEKGKPAKNKYRRFKIKSFVGNDDFRAMHEVVGRRYVRVMEEGGVLPDVILIDGGAGQVGVARAAFVAAGISLDNTMLMGLAKKEETFVFADGRAELTLPREHLGLRLLQRVRDEAHRVANGFNAELRSRQIKTSILDDIPGVGPIKRAKLLEKFPTLERVKKATKEELSAVVGPVLAARVAEIVNKARNDEGEALEP